MYRIPAGSFSCIVFFAVILFVSLSSCSSAIKKNDEKIITAADLYVDTTLIPHDTVDANNPAIHFNNGLYFFNQNKFSGVLLSSNSDKTLSAYSNIYNGMKHGTYRSYYSSGKPFEVRQYKNNLATGRHYGYWENGNLQFDYLYFNEKKTGYFKKWYNTGKPFIFANYTNDNEEGLQRGWRPNGKLFLNYVAKDGHTYGLQETALCYILKDEQLKR